MTRRVKVTMAMLDRLGACKTARWNLAPLLPATISTDPLENLDLCDTMGNVCDSPRVYWGNMPCAAWLYRRLLTPDPEDCDCSMCIPQGPIRDADLSHFDVMMEAQPWVAAQYLAWCAAILAKRGAR